MNLTYYPKSVFAFCLFLILYACSPMKPGGSSEASKSGSNLFETFYVGEGNTQYFIKPIVFENENKEQFILDFTFKYKDNLNEKMILKASLLSNLLTKELDQVIFTNGKIKKNIDLENIKLLFSERDKKLFLSRFSMESNLSQFKQLFNSPNWKIKIKGFKPFTPKNSTHKKISRLNYSIFELM
ncbi:MAG: hypothetical protein AB8B61_03670 [Cyclobacteriaceae bacterium]